MFMGMAQNGAKADTFMAMGVDPAAERRMGFTLRMTQGRELSSAAEAMVADGLAHSLNLKVGDTVKLLAVASNGGLNAVDVRVTGTYSVGMREVDDHAVRIALPAAQRLLATERVSTVVVGLDATENTDKAYTALAAGLGRERPDIAIRKWVDMATFYRQCRGLFNGIFAFSGVIVFFMVVMSSANTMMMCMFRTAEGDRRHAGHGDSAVVDHGAVRHGGDDHGSVRGADGRGDGTYDWRNAESFGTGIAAASGD